MTILHLLTNEPDATQRKIMEEHEKNHEVHTVDLRETRDYDLIVDHIVSCDKVISW